ncbi:hypothetical protein [uncultured Sanguibacteroides sp.]|uniref:hypothetical protein n=1 Tax=uncultured Sanguibacteroides sp. TaxID=1635151 RepID=UPI0025E66015|nr:hypothetical protein [uncultured Sanguibacteroides sp.]
MNNTTSFIVKNIAALFLMIFVVQTAIHDNGGYNWVFSMLKGNLEMIKHYPRMSQVQKNEIKHGANFNYLHFLKTNTPPDAVILFPPKDTLLHVKLFKDKLSNSASLRNRIWASYFIYPRKIVYADSLKECPAEVTHIAIIDKHGYEYVKDSVDWATAPAFSVIPVKK